MDKHCTPSAEKIIQFNESAIQGHLSEMVRHSVEETLNQMLEAEAERLCNAEKYQRNEARRDTRAGFYQRKLHTKAGEVTLNMPSCGGRPLRPRSSSATAGGKPRWRKR